jgi:transcriptional regulator of arginine metabolism
MSAVAKAERQRRILALIQEHTVHTQEQLAQLLRAEGIEATQVTLSRDIRELGLAKSAAGYVEMGPGAGKFIVLARDYMTSAVAAGNLVVLRTSPGHAMSLAIALDSEDWPGVVGTIAGDDTIFVAMPDAAAAQKLAAEFRGYLE